MKTSTSTYAILAAALLAPQWVHAQETEQAGEEIVADTSETAPQPQKESRLGLDTVVVTAQKREESLKATSIAISAFAGSALEDRGIDDVSNLQSYIPNFHVGQEQDGVKISLRGVGIQGTGSITDPGVAFYQDGFYVPRPSGGSAVFFDVDRVEVLRGPQGTLYGRNATGGVVNVISKEPVFHYEGKVGATFGSRDLMEYRGMVNVPLGENLATRLAVVHAKEDGYHENLSEAPGSDDFYGSDGDLSVRGQMLYDNQNGFTVLLSGLHSDLNSTGLPYTFLERNLGGPPPVQAYVSQIGAEPSDPLQTINDHESFNDATTTQGFIRITKEFGGVEAFLQAGLLDQETNLVQDFDGSDLDISVFHKDQENEAQSFEFRLSSIDAEKLNWILGAYYFNEETYILRRVELNGLTPGGVISLPDFLLDEWGNSSTAAIFGSGTWSFTDDVRLTLGLRHTQDKKDGAKVTRGNFGAPFPADVPNDQFDADETFSETTWKIGAEWNVTDTALTYANISRGYKAGGFNSTSSGSPYDPETVLAYEAGLKSNPFGGMAKVNADVFYYDYEDMQLSTLTTINGAPGQFTSNAAKATIYGLELDTNFSLTDSTLLSLSYSYISAEFDEYFNNDPRELNPPFNPNDPEGLGRQDLSGNRVPYVPENTFTIGLQQEFDLSDGGSILASLTSTWHDALYMREYNSADIDLQESNTKTDATLAWFVADTGLSLTAYVTNIEDESELANIYISPGFIGTSATAQYTRPRTIGIRLDYEF